MTSTPFEPPKRGRLAGVLVVEQPGEVLRGGQQDLLLLLARQGDVAHLSACIGRVLTDAGLWGDRRLRTGSAIQQEFTA